MDGRMFSIKRLLHLILVGAKKGNYSYDIPKMDSEIKISRAMIMMFEGIQKKRQLSQREKDDLDYHKARLTTLEHDNSVEKQNREKIS